LGSEKEPLDHPLIIKETSPDGDRFWSSMQELNRKLRRTCIVIDVKFPNLGTNFKPIAFVRD
jgi:hypothetical protein